MNKSLLKISEPRLEIILNSKWAVYHLWTKRDHQLQRELQHQKQVRKQPSILQPDLKYLSQIELQQSNNPLLLLWFKTMESVEAEKSLLKPLRKLLVNWILFQELSTYWTRESQWTKNRLQMLCPISKSLKTRKQTKFRAVNIVRWTWAILNPKETWLMLTIWTEAKDQVLNLASIKPQLMTKCAVNCSNTSQAPVWSIKIVSVAQWEESNSNNQIQFTQMTSTCKEILKEISNIPLI